MFEGGPSGPPFLIFLKFQTKPPKIYDIMNSDEFILEVPAELRMRRK